MQNEDTISTLFLSYDGQHVALAARLGADLKSAGFDVWQEQFDRKSDDNTADTLSEKLRQCLVFIPVISPSYKHDTIKWPDLERITANTSTHILAATLPGANVPDWAYQTVDFGHWHNTIHYANSLEKLTTLLKVRFPATIGGVPDSETRYIAQVHAEVERYRAFLSTISARAASMPTDKTAIYPYSMWGLTGIFESDDGDQTYQLQEILKQYPAFILVGDNGSGKTTTLYRTLLEILRAHLSDREEFPLPVLVNLGLWYENVSFETFLHQHWPTELDSDVLLILDGLDEMGQPAQHKFGLLADWLVETPRRVIIATDPNTWPVDILGLPLIHLQPLNISRVRQYVLNHVEKDTADQLLAVISPDGDTIAMPLAQNALNLAIMVAQIQTSPVSRLPDHESHLLAWLVEHLWQTLEDRPGYRQWSEAHQPLSQLAFTLIDEEQGSYVPYPYAQEIVGDDLILQAALDVDILNMRGAMIGFSLRKIRDFCAAYWLLEVEGVYTRLMQAQFDDSGKRLPWKWDRTVIYSAALTADPDTVIRDMMDVNPYLAVEALTGGIRASEATQHQLALRFLQHPQPTDQLYLSRLMEVLRSLPDLSPLLEQLYNIAREQDEEVTMSIGKLGGDTIRFLTSILRGDRKDRRRSMAAWALGELQEPTAVPGLIEALNDQNARVRQEAVHALERIGPPTIPRLLRSLQNNDPNMRAGAIQVLRRMATPATVPDLVACLPDDRWPEYYDARICDLAAVALENIGTDEALQAVDEWRSQHADNQLVRTGEHPAASDDRPIEQLEQYLKSDQWETRRSAVEALGVSGKTEAIPLILQALEDEENLVRWKALRALSNFDGPPVIEGLIRALHDPDHLTADAAATELSRIGEPAVSALIAALSDENVNVRGNAAEALGRIGSEDAIPYLVDLLEDTEVPQRETQRICDIAANALRSIGTEQANMALRRWYQTSPDAQQNSIRSLLDLDSLTETDEASHHAALIAFLDTLQEDDWKERHQAAKALRTYARDTLKGTDDKAAISELAEALNNDEAMVRWTATEALAWTGDKDAVPALLKRLTDSNWTVRIAAVRALVELSNQDAVPGLVEALKDTHQLVREAVAEALGQLNVHNTRAISELVNIMHADPDEFVRRAATEALGKIGDSELAKELVNLLEYEQNYYVRWAAVEALGQIGSATSVPALIEALSDTTQPGWAEQRICDVAASALGSIGTEEARTALSQWRDRN